MTYSDRRMLTISLVARTIAALAHAYQRVCEGTASLIRAKRYAAPKGRPRGRGRNAPPLGDAGLHAYVV